MTSGCDVSSCWKPARVVIVFHSGGRYAYCSEHGAPHVRRADVDAYEIREDQDA